MKNVGQTPATHITVLESAKVVPWPMTRPPAPENKSYFGTMSLVGDFIDCSSDDEVIVTPDELSWKTKAIVLVGKVTYTDAFGKVRTTDFCFYITGHQALEGGKMFIYEPGNEST